MQETKERIPFAASHLGIDNKRHGWQLNQAVQVEPGVVVVAVDR